MILSIQYQCHLYSFATVYCEIRKYIKHCCQKNKDFDVKVKLKYQGMFETLKSGTKPIHEELVSTLEHETCKYKK